MAIDPQVGVPVSIGLVMLSIIGQVVTYFLRPKESDNGNKKQLEVNSKKIEQLDGDISRIDLDTRSMLLKLSVIEEQVKSNVLEILNLRPRFHQLGNELTRLSNDIVHLQEEEERRRGKR